jgi:hypothetical protein
MSVSSLCKNSLSAKLGMVHPKYPGETLFLKRHIYKSMTLNGRACTDCDEDHRSLPGVFLSREKVSKIMETPLSISPSATKISLTCGKHESMLRTCQK